MKRRLHWTPYSAVLLGLLQFPGSPANAAPATMPEPPQGFVETEYSAPSGGTIAVREGDDLQRALDEAEPGEVIALEAGATFVGPFTLPDKPGSEWITIRSDAPDDRLPSPGNRIDPSYASALAKLVAPRGSVISTAPGAHHYRFIGVEFRPARSNERSTWQVLESLWKDVRGGRRSSGKGTFLYALVSLDVDESSVDALPHHIIFDRCYLHGDPDVGTRRGIVMNSRHTAVIDSYLSDFKEVRADSQAIVGWGGPGPFKIVNNYLEAAGENVMFGGADPSIQDLVPSDIEIRNNHFFKPLSWKAGHPQYAGKPWTVKNLFELKNARRVLVDGNLFEHNWPHAQDGFAILFTVRNQQGSAPWSVVEDVIFRNNVVRNVGSGVNILGHDNIHPSRRTRRILIENNLLSDVGAPWGEGRLFQLLDGTKGVVIRNNTAIQSGSMIVGGDGRPHRDFVFVGNIVRHNEYGIIGSNVGVGMPSIKRYFPGATIRDNVMIGGPAERYPEENLFPDTLGAVGFVDGSEDDYRLGESGAYPWNRGDGKSLGVDFGTLCAAITSAARNTVDSCAEDRR